MSYPRGADARAFARRGRGKLTVLLMVCSGLTGAAAVASPASASDLYCSFVSIAPGGHCDGPQHHLAGNTVETPGVQWSKCAGAVLNGSFYASYACSYSTAEHCYDRSHLLQPRAHNSDFAYHTFTSRSYYLTTDVCP